MAFASSSMDSESVLISQPYFISSWYAIRLSRSRSASVVYPGCAGFSRGLSGDFLLGISAQRWPAAGDLPHVLHCGKRIRCAAAFYLRRLQKGLKTRMAAEGIEVGVSLRPALEPSAMREHLFEAANRFLRFSKKCINAGHIVKDSAIVRINFERPSQPLQASSADSQMNQPTCPEVEGPRII